MGAYSTLGWSQNSNTWITLWLKAVKNIDGTNRFGISELNAIPIGGYVYVSASLWPILGSDRVLRVDADLVSLSLSSLLLQPSNSRHVRLRLGFREVRREVRMDRGSADDSRRWKHHPQREFFLRRLFVRPG